MAVKYADRAFLSVNGVAVADLQSSSLRQNFNARPVDTMTPDKFNRGFVQGNTHIDIGLNLAVQKDLARPKIDQIDFEANDISITYECGSDQFVALGCFKKDASDESSGVGSESRFAINLGATKLVDAVGNAAELFEIQLA
jgi:hypothetical protein